MSDRVRLVVPLLLIAAVAGAGIFETARTEQFGVLGLLCAIELLTVAVAFSLLAWRRPLMVRADLASWLDSAAALTGESTSDIVNRAVSSYRAGLSDDRRD